jgi:hypothetical protein
MQAVVPTAKGVETPGELEDEPERLRPAQGDAAGERRK